MHVNRHIDCHAIALPVCFPLVQTHTQTSEASLRKEFIHILCYCCAIKQVTCQFSSWSSNSNTSDMRITRTRWHATSIDVTTVGIFKISFFSVCLMRMARVWCKKNSNVFFNRPCLWEAISTINFRAKGKRLCGNEMWKKLSGRVRQWTFFIIDECSCMS